MKIGIINTVLVEQLRAFFHPKDRSVILDDNCFIEFDILDSAPDNPPSGRIKLYMRADNLYMLESDGTETLIS